MAVTVAGTSASGLQVERMMTTAYLEGRTKVNGTSGLRDQGLHGKQPELRLIKMAGRHLQRRTDEVPVRYYRIQKSDAGEISAS